MGDKTGIIWTEKTWNPVSGCKEVSPGCGFCYAKKLAEGKRGFPAFPDGFDLTLRPWKLKEPFKYPEPSLVFVNSMSDFFWELIPDTYRDQMLDVIRQTPQHEYQVLTKRPELMLEYLKNRPPLPANFWAGVTIENKKTLSRLDELRRVPAEIRFVSFEPLLEDLGTDYTLDGIQWVITGGESGDHLKQERWRIQRGMVLYNEKANKFVPDPEKIPWIRNILKKARESGTSFFHKQWGGSYPEAAGRLLDGEYYSEIPRLPGGRTHIKNDYLAQLEGGREHKAGKGNQGRLF